MVPMLFVFPDKGVLHRIRKFQYSIPEEMESVSNLDSTFPVMMMKVALLLLSVASEEYSRPLTEVSASEVALLVPWITMVLFFLTMKMKGNYAEWRANQPSDNLARVLYAGK